MKKKLSLLILTLCMALVFFQVDAYASEDLGACIDISLSSALVNLGEAVDFTVVVTNVGNEKWCSRKFYLALKCAGVSGVKEYSFALPSKIRPNQSFELPLSIPTGPGEFFNTAQCITSTMQMINNDKPFDDVAVFDVQITEEDSTPPVISCMSPLYDAQLFTSPLITVTGSVDEPVSVFTLNKTAYPVTYIDGMYHFNFEFQLTQGENELLFVAVDNTGNQSVLTRVVMCDSEPPTINIVKPVEGTVITRVPFPVVVESDERDIPIFFNGTRIFEIEHSKYMGWINALQKGENELLIEAHDASGNVRTKSVNVLYEQHVLADDYQLWDHVEETVPYMLSHSPNRAPFVNTVSSLPFSLRNRNKRVAGKEIVFEIVNGNGVLLQQSAITDEDGLVTVDLRTGTNVSDYDCVIAKMKNNEEVKSEVRVFSQPNNSFIIVDQDSDRKTFFSNACVDVPLRVEDEFGNPHKDVTVTGELISGYGNLVGESKVTSMNGETLFQVEVGPASINHITLRFRLVDDPDVYIDVDVDSESALASITKEEVFAILNSNSARISDYQADMHVVSTFDYLPSEATMRIWQKANMQRVEQFTPEQKISVRPKPQRLSEPIPESMLPQKTLYSYDAENEKCVLKTDYSEYDKSVVVCLHVDLVKGVIERMERVQSDSFGRLKSVTQNSDFVEVEGAWLYTKQTETMYGLNDEVVGETVTTYSNIRVNTGLDDTFFEK